MPARSPQTHAKRARELAVREKRELKAAKKAERAAAKNAPEDEIVADEPSDDDGE